MNNWSIRIFAVTSLLFISTIAILIGSDLSDLLLNWERWSAVTLLLITVTVLSALGTLSGLIELRRCHDSQAKSMTGIIGNSCVLLFILLTTLS